MVRRLASMLVGVTALLAALVSPGQAAYPERPVTIIAPFAAGGGVDRMARLMARHLETRLGQPFIVENRAGGDGMVGARATARAPGDGYTIMITSSTFSLNPIVMNAAYVVERDFVPITLIGDIPLVLVGHPSLPANTVADLVRLSHERPLFYGTSGSNTHLQTEALIRPLGLKAERVPYKGGGEAVPALLGNQIQLLVISVPNVLAHVQAGTLKAFLLSDPYRRLPDVPKLDQIGLSEEARRSAKSSSWYGVLAPARTPADIVAKLHDNMAAIAAMPEVKQRFDDEGFNIKMTTPEGFAEFLRLDSANWRKLAGEMDLLAK